MRQENRVRVAVYSRTVKSRYKSLKAVAKLRHIPVGLTLIEYAAIVSSGVCTYCGGLLPHVGSGVDRKKSSLGYRLDNCVACCTTCNMMRGHDAISYDEMFEVIRLLRRLRGSNV